MDKISLSIDAKVLFQMYEYAAYAHYHFGTEIAGWGHCADKKGIYKLAPLTRQEVSGAEVDNFPNEILNDTKYNISDMIVQWHSHVNMSTNPSPTDISTIKEALKIMPIIISIIVNCKNQYSARLDFIRISKLVRLPSQITLDVELIPYYSNPIVSKEVKTKCHKPKPKPAIIYNNSYDSDFSNYVEHPSFKKDGQRYYWHMTYQCYGYWDDKSEFIPYGKPSNNDAYGAEQLKLGDLSLEGLPLVELNIILSRMSLIARDNPEFEYISTHDADTLQHKDTGLSLVATDMGVLYGQRIGGKELIDDFLNDCKNKKVKDDKATNPA